MKIFSMYEKALDAVRANKPLDEFSESMVFVVLYILKYKQSVEFTAEYPGEEVTVYKDKGEISIIYPGVSSTYTEEHIQLLAKKCYEKAINDELVRLDKLKKTIQ